MKKVVAAVMTTVLLGAACAGFTACGDDGKEVFKEAENFASQKVNKEEFEAALAATNFQNVKYDFSMIATIRDQTEADQTGVMIIDGEKEHVKIEGIMVNRKEEGNQKFEAYYTAGTTMYNATVYYEKDGAWVTKTLSEEDYDNFSDFRQYQPSGVLLQEILYLRDIYESFTFDEEKKGYYFDHNSVDSYLLKFNEGKLYCVTIWSKNLVGREGEAERNFVFTYGGQSVTLPTV